MVCKNDRPITIKEFKGTNIIVSNMPARYDTREKYYKLIGNNLKFREYILLYRIKKIIITLIKVTLTLFMIIRL